MAALAWRVAREETRRSEARVAALAADIHDDSLPLHHHAPVVTSGDLFSASEPARSSSRFAASLGTGALVFCGAVVIMYVGSGIGRTSLSTPLRTPADGTAPAAAPAQAAPLELTALTHERDADHLTVRGIVRNPASGTEVSRLTAVVSLFGRDGGFLTSGQAAIDAAALAPGAESWFVVTVPAGGEVGRYRVSFKRDDRVVPHVDRRERTVAEARPR